MFLVTGGAGFIGSHTARALLTNGHAVRVLDDLSTGRREALPAEVELQVGSIEDPDAVGRALRGVSHVIHLAARVSVPASWDDPSAFERTNVGGFLTVLRGAARSGAQRVVYASSCAVYGSSPGLPKREDAPLAPESPYAATKLADEAFASAWGRCQPLQTVGLRYFNVIGAGQDPSGPYGAVLPRFVEAAVEGRPLQFHGDGLQGRDFVSVSDVARANLAASLADTPPAAVFNIGSGRMTTILELSGLVEAAVGQPLTRHHHPPRAGDVRFSQADISAALAHLGWGPTEPVAHTVTGVVRTWKAPR